MLKVVLAGLVIQGVLNLEEAEYVAGRLGDSQVPRTVEETVDQIVAVRNDYRKASKMKNRVIKKLR